MVCFCLIIGTTILAAVIAYLLDLLSIKSIFEVVRNLIHGKGLLKSVYQVDEESRNHGGELVADVLKAHGVEAIFTLCGGHISPILIGCQQRQIKVVDVRHEAAAVFAADAVARLGQTIGVAAVTAGPGLTNTVTAVKNAQMAESPVLLLGGAAATALKGLGALQDIDQMCLFKPLCKYTATVTRVRDTVPILRKAIQAAKSGRPGPVFVEFPIDSLYPYHLVRKEMGIVDQPRSIQQRITNWYMELYLSRLYNNAWKSQPLEPLPVHIPLPSNSAVSNCLKILQSAERPLMIIGSQSMLPPTNPHTLAAAVNTLGIPCYLGGMARGLLGRSGYLHIRQQRRDALKEADVVILAGTVCDFRLSYGRVLSRKSKIIAINRDSEQLYKNSTFPVSFWKPSAALKADVGTTLVELSRLAERAKYRVDSKWVEKLRDRDAEKEAKNREMANLPTEHHLNPLKVLHHVDEVMPEDAIIVADGGDFVGSAAYILRPRGPLQWLDPGAFGTLGVGGGFALGAKICKPDRSVWIIYGDGALGYSLIEYDTYARHKLPIVSIVGNDASWMQIAREQLPMFGSTVGCDLSFSHYHNAAEALGGRGLLMDKEDDKEIPDLLEQVRDWSLVDHKPVLVNALIGRTSFRDGSISV